eukprot:GHUV01047546.1.p1 GENE.GHUV01047546.1~~GHUV01047546.1.p1  ORF type:complete len:122 (-),score=5.05 GHUV01047546.1:373-738(-)
MEWQQENCSKLIVSAAAIMVVPIVSQWFKQGHDYDPSKCIRFADQLTRSSRRWTRWAASTQTARGCYARIHTFSHLSTRFSHHLRNVLMSAMLLHLSCPSHLVKLLGTVPAPVSCLCEHQV